MREIVITKNTKVVPKLSVCAYGASGSGKTEFAATWPNPLFLSAGTENGWDTIRSLVSVRPEKLYNPAVMPLVWVLDEPADMMKKLKEIPELIKSKSIKTIVVDSITFYARMYKVFLEQRMKSANGWDIYAALQSHIENMQLVLHGFDVNIVWLALDREGHEKRAAGPLIEGSSSKYIPASCSQLLYARSYSINDELKYELHLKPFGGQPVKCRVYAKDPISSLLNPTYRSFVEALGFEL